MLSAQCFVSECCVIVRHRGRALVTSKQRAEKDMQTSISAFLKDEGGATAIEYALIATLMGVGVVAALFAVRTQLQGSFSDIATHFQAINS